MNRGTFFVAFVDIAGHENQKPNIYLVPSVYLNKECAGWIDNCKGKMIRFKPKFDWMKRFKIEDNKWDLLREAGITASEPSVDEENVKVGMPAEADPSTSSG